MNRRKAIYGVLLGTAGAAGITGGLQWWKLTHSPDLQYLDTNHELIGALAETILPATTDSPGATEAGVAGFIVKMIKNCTPVKEQNSFIDGLKRLHDHTLNRYHAPYTKCTPAQQEETMAWFERDGQPLNGTAGKILLRLKGRSFFQILKAYTVEGYCTSEPGATKGLRFLYIPGSFQGCMPLEPGQRSWATD
jgi:hypothetical protein